MSKLLLCIVSLFLISCTKTTNAAKPEPPYKYGETIELDEVGDNCSDGIVVDYGAHWVNGKPDHWHYKVKSSCFNKQTLQWHEIEITKQVDVK